MECVFSLVLTENSSSILNLKKNYPAFLGRLQLQVPSSLTWTLSMCHISHNYKKVILLTIDYVESSVFFIRVQK